MSDIILISKVGLYETVRCAICKNPNQTERGCDGSCQYDKELHAKIVEAVTGISEKRPHGEWRPKPLPRATHCLVAIKWAPDDIEVTEADTTFLLKEHSERIIAWMPLPDPPKGGDS